MVVQNQIVVNPVPIDPIAGVAGRKPERDEALDFTKGSLVLFMVLYHWIAYFVSLDWDVFRYLRFITPSFILITGFVVSNVYLAKHSYGDPRLHQRLLKRGFKLLLLFTALNVVGDLLLGGNQGGVSRFIGDAYGIYLAGSGRASFDVLVPISYFLLLCPLILKTSNALRLPLYMVGIVSVVLVSIATMLGVKNGNLELLSIGILGMGVGSFPISRFNAALRHPWALIGAYVLYVLAIMRWNVLFPLQVVGVLLSLMLIYIVGVKCGSRGVVQRLVIELGKYSLFAYIFHIFVLQILRRGLRHFDVIGDSILVPFVATLTVTVLVIVFLGFARQKSRAMDRLYRVVFA